MRKRRKKRSPPPFRRFATLVVVALLLPASVNWLRNHVGLLEDTGERLAILAAAVNMPEEGIDLLRERYESELRLPEESGGAPGPGEDGAHDDIPYHIPPVQEEAPSDEEPDMPEPAAPGATAPKIPAQYRAEIISENFAAVDSTALVKYGAGHIKNESYLDNEAVEEILEIPFDLGFTDTDEPQVLIVHTHATEAFERYDSEYYDTRNTWRSRDNNMNMVSVGAAMAEVLEENGIAVLHDTTQHDYPSYNGSYERSAQTIREYLEDYPSIKVVLDLHRDAMERDNDTIIKPVTVIDGQKAAQVMIIAAADDTGQVGVPNYRQNLRFAAALQSYAASSYPELMRPVYFCYRKYNMDLTPGSLLLEFGSNANTLEEAVYAARMVGQALVDLIYDHMEYTE